MFRPLSLINLTLSILEQIEEMHPLKETFTLNELISVISPFKIDNSTAAKHNLYIYNEIIEDLISGVKRSAQYNIHISKTRLLLIFNNLQIEWRDKEHLLLSNKYSLDTTAFKSIIKFASVDDDVIAYDSSHVDSYTDIAYPHPFLGFPIFATSAKAEVRTMVYKRNHGSSIRTVLKDGADGSIATIHDTAIIAVISSHFNSLHREFLRAEALIANTRLQLNPISYFGNISEFTIKVSDITKTLGHSKQLSFACVKQSLTRLLNTMFIFDTSFEYSKEKYHAKADDSIISKLEILKTNKCGVPTEYKISINKWFIDLFFAYKNPLIVFLEKEGFALRNTVHKSLFFILKRFVRKNVYNFKDSLLFKLLPTYFNKYLKRFKLRVALFEIHNHPLFKAYNLNLLISKLDKVKYICVRYQGKNHDKVEDKIAKPSGTLKEYLTRCKQFNLFKKVPFREVLCRSYSAREKLKDVSKYIKDNFVFFNSKEKDIFFSSG